MSAITAHELISPDQVGKGSVLTHDGTERGAQVFQVFIVIFRKAAVIGRRVVPLLPPQTWDGVHDCRV